MARTSPGWFSASSSRAHACRLGAVLLALLLAPPSADAQSVQLPIQVPAGSWREVPNTKLKDAWASWRQPEFLPRGALTGASAIITAWNSAALDTKRSVLVLPRTGGHADWAGNQVVGFDLKGLKWVLLRPPSTHYPPLDPAKPPATYVNPYDDGTPASVHTYDAVEYLPTVDRIWSAGGIFWSPGGESAPSKTWWWNPSNGDWEAKITRPGGYGTSARWLESMHRLLVRTSSGMYTYDPGRDEYKVLFEQSLPASSSSIAIDEGGRKAYRLANKMLTTVDLSNPSAKETLAPLTGETPFTTLSGTGVIFHGGKVVVYGDAPNMARGVLYVIDPVTKTAVRHEPEDAVQPPRPTRQGMWKRFFAYGGYFWVVTQWNDNVWVFNPGTTGFPRQGPPRPAPPQAPPDTSPSPPPPSSPPPSGPTGPPPPPSSSPSGPPLPPSSPPSGPPTPPSSPPTGPPTSPSPGPIPPPVPIASIPNRTWVARPQPALGAGPSVSRGKHMRLIHDSKRGRMVLTGGDYPYTKGDGNALQLVWSIDLAKGSTWDLLHGWCAPPGGVQPARPDNVTWVYDSRRDQGVVMPAYFFGPAGCPGVTEAKDAYIFNFTTNRWETPPWPKGSYGGDLHNHFGVYDAISDTIYRFYWKGSLFIQTLDRTKNAWDMIALRGRPGVSGSDVTNDQPAIDVQGRSIYVISRPLKALLRYSITSKDVVETIPLPAGWVGPVSEFHGTDMETYLAFDSVNRVLLNPVTQGYGGKVVGLGIYHVDTKKWEWEDVPATVTGNTLGFDATNNVFLFLGRSASRSFWLYRYGSKK